MAIKLTRYQKLYGRDIINQKPSALLDASVVPVYLPLLLKVITAVEEQTGHAWTITSYVRNSPSHRTGEAIDIAPLIAADSKYQYAVFNGSDPVLYKRVPLMRSLQALAHNYNLDNYDVGIFVEPDHLHIQLFEPEEQVGKIHIVQWKQEKPVYSDSKDRIKLPLTETGYKPRTSSVI